MDRAKSVASLGGVAVLVLVLLAACSKGVTGSPPLPSATSLAPLAAGPTASATAALPPPQQTPSGPVERPVALDTPVDAVYIPGQMLETYLLDSEQARRVGVRLDPTDGGDALRLEAVFYDADGKPVPHVSAQVGQPLLREEWDLTPGRYTIRLFGPETRPRAFVFTVISRPTPAAGGGTIAYGESRSGEIAVRGQRDQWIFEGRTGDRIVITMIAPGADGYLELYSGDGQLLARNDDSRLGHNPVLEFALPAGGQYLIVARTYDDDQTGAYQLTLERLP